MRSTLCLLLICSCAPLALAGGGNAPALVSNPRAAPLLGTVGTTTVSGTDSYSGLTFPAGTTIAGPFEAGFDSEIDTLLGWLGCSPASKGYLCGGTDTQTALEQVNYQCGANLPSVSSSGVFKSLMYACGVHSPPNTAKCTSPPGGGVPGYTTCSNAAYHFHQNMTCLYNTAAAGHSTKIGVTTATAVPTAPIYGKWEATNVLPSLDACGGHFGVTPDSNGATVYHHHVQDKAPFVVGCYGPNKDGGLVTLAQCRSYYSTCGDSDVTTITTTKGTFLYDRWCPCYDNTTASNTNVVGATTGVTCTAGATGRSPLAAAAAGVTGVLVLLGVALSL